MREYNPDFDASVSPELAALAEASAERAEEAVVASAPVQPMVSLTLLDALAELRPRFTYQLVNMETLDQAVGFTAYRSALPSLPTPTNHLVYSRV